MKHCHTRTCAQLRTQPILGHEEILTLTVSHAVNRPTNSVSVARTSVRRRRPVPLETNIIVYGKFR